MFKRFIYISKAFKFICSVFKKKLRRNFLHACTKMAMILKKSVFTLSHNNTNIHVFASKNIWTLFSVIIFFNYRQSNTRINTKIHILRSFQVFSMFSVQPKVKNLFFYQENEHKSKRKITHKYMYHNIWLKWY